MCLLSAVFAVVAVYVLYLFLSYHRIADAQELTVRAPEDASSSLIAAGEVCSAMTYNVGFGAYTPEYSFFMDGGKYSWALSRESVENTITGAAQLTKQYDPDLMLFQEVDLDATRSYHVDQYELINQSYEEFYSVFAVNYDSAFLFYPFHQPHGKNKSGLAMYSRYPVSTALRRSLPVSDSLSKILDLDRCYSISRIPVSNGKELVLINIHMSAYGNSDEVREGQISTLLADMEKEYAAGNYVICGGDFNHDLKAEESAEEVASWAYPFPRQRLGESFRFCMDTLPEGEKDALWNSSRNADIPYVEGVTYTLTLDGFIVSDNVECVRYENVKTGYRYADHEPVYMEFILKE